MEKLIGPAVKQIVRNIKDKYVHADTKTRNQRHFVRDIINVFSHT